MRNWLFRAGSKKAYAGHHATGPTAITAVGVIPKFMDRAGGGDLDAVFSASSLKQLGKECIFEV